MKRLIIVLSMLVCANVSPNVQFRGQSAFIKVSSGGTLTLSNPLLVTNGKIVKESGASLTGEDIEFTNGILQDAGNDLILTAVFDPAGTIMLSGDTNFRADSGKVLQTIMVSGANNIIEGRPILADTIILQDSTTTLTLATQSTINKNIVMNGGKVILEDNLYFSDLVAPTGSGTIDVNGYRVEFGGKDFTPTSTIEWMDATDVTLNSRTTLNTQWTFTGTNNLNGNGNVLDISGGGTLRVPANSTLYMTDIVIKGLGNTGSIVLVTSTSRVRMSNVDIQVDGNVTTSIGSVYVEGPTTFTVKNNTWTFDTTSLLTVDGVTLWKDVAGGSLGDVLFGSLANYSLVSSGTICFKVCKKLIDDLQTSTGYLQSQIDELETSTGYLQSQIDELESQSDLCCEELKTSTGYLQSQIDELETSTGYLQSQIDALETSTGYLQSQIDECCKCRDCFIVVDGDLYFDYSMLPPANTAVIFEFCPCFGDMSLPRVIFDSAVYDPLSMNNGTVTLAERSRVLFTGEGIVEVKAGTSFYLDGQDCQETPTGLYGDDWPQLIIEERARFHLEEDAVVTVSGHGIFQVRDAGYVLLDNVSWLIFGDDLFDCLSIRADGLGAFILDNPEALLTFQRGRYDVLFNQSSNLSVMRGIVEFNMNNGQPTTDGIPNAGVLNSLRFTEGSSVQLRKVSVGANLLESGLLRMSPNLDDIPVIFDNRTGVIYGGEHRGNGHIQYINFDTLPNINTKLLIQDNYFTLTRPISDIFMELALILESGPAIIPPSDVEILVRLGSTDASIDGDLAALSPLRNGSAVALQDGDHDVSYDGLKIIGSNIEGNQFEITGYDSNGQGGTRITIASTI